MRRVFLVAAALVLFGLAVPPGPAAAAPNTVEITTDPAHFSVGLGDRFTITTTLTNTGAASTGNLLAHLNIANTDGTAYVDPEDWSADRSQELALGPGETRTLSWSVQAVNRGRFVAYVVVLPRDGAPSGPDHGVVSPLARLEVAARSTLTAASALPVVLGMPLGLGLGALGLWLRSRRRGSDRAAGPSDDVMDHRESQAGAASVA